MKFRAAFAVALVMAAAALTVTERTLPALAQARSTAVPSASTGWAGDLSPIAATDWSYDRAAHLIERAGFGAHPDEIARLAAMTPQQAVDELVDFESIEQRPEAIRRVRSSGIRAWIRSRRAAPKRCASPASAAKGSARRCCRRDRSAGSSPSSTSSSTASPPTPSKRSGSACGGRTACSRRRRPLEEKLTLFWHGHFATGENKVRDYRMMLRQNEMFRARASGQLPRPAGRDPERSGDARLSRQRRERQDASERELRPRAARAVHDGRGPLHGARRSRGRPRVHRMDERRAGRSSSTPTSTTSARRRSSAGRDPSTARTSSTSSSPSRSPPNSSPRSSTGSSCARRSPAPSRRSWAGRIRDSGYQMKPLLKRIFLSKDFYSPPAFATQIKSPVHLVSPPTRRSALARGADDSRLRPHDRQPRAVAVRSAERRRLGRRPHLDHAVDAAAAAATCSAACSFPTSRASARPTGRCPPTDARVGQRLAQGHEHHRSHQGRRRRQHDGRIEHDGRPRRGLQHAVRRIQGQPARLRADQADSPQSGGDRSDGDGRSRRRGHRRQGRGSLRPPVPVACTLAGHGDRAVLVDFLRGKLGIVERSSRAKRWRNRSASCSISC